LQALENDPKAVERMARERYFMKRPNEDIFVYVEEED
jgi:cell division protein FtsB